MALTLKNHVTAVTSGCFPLPGDYRITSRDLATLPPDNLVDR